MEKPSQWERIKEIVGAALEREPSRRGVYLDEACADDPALRAEVDSLVSAYEKSDDLSQSPFTGALLNAPQESQSIGPYRLLKRLGEGGMGQVWLAEQTVPVQRQVALKLIRAGMLHSAVLQRFQAERQSLALMDHPAIAKVFDAGATPNGQPFFVMEYVEGLPITEYCDQKKLSLHERLQLFIQVCEGVQHAHQKAIIHRDLKPANILVVEIDGKPRPRIIDFGLAKATAPLIPGETLFTQAGALLGTPGYMSPEQTDPAAQDIDTRTDVYSLGVILYELLTGSLPFDTEQLKRQPLDQMVRRLREEDPQTPSAKVGNDLATSTLKARARGTEARELVTLLSGDLDWITMKALEKDRNRRYGTPSELAADIERYIQNRPVLARPASAGYRLRKYVRRNRAGVVVAAGAVSLLIAFAAMQAIQLRRITRERDRANRITDFMTSMFKVSNPSESRGNTITAREILDKTSQDIGAGLDKDPELKAQLLHVMGTVYQSLGLFPRAESLLQQAVDIRRQVLGPEHPDTLNSMNRLAWAVHQEGRYADAEKLDRQLLETERRVLGPENRLTLATMSNLSSILNAGGHPGEAEKLSKQTYEAQQRNLGSDDPDTLQTMRELAWTLRSNGHYAEAEQLCRQGLDIRKRVSGPEHKETLLAMAELGLLFEDEGRHADSEQLLRETLQIQRRVLGNDHENTITTMDNLAITLQHEGRYEEADSLYREALAASRRVLGPEHRATLLYMNNLATIFLETERYREAEKLLRQALEIQRRTLGTDHPDTALSLFNIADIMRRERRFPEAAAIFRETLDIQRRVLGPNHPDTIDTAYNLACVLALDHKRDEALAALREAIEDGYSDSEHLKKDDDLKFLRGDHRFDELVAKAKTKSPAASIPK